MKKIIAIIISVPLIFSSCINVFAIKKVPAEAYDSSTSQYKDTYSLIGERKPEGQYSLVAEIFGEEYVINKLSSPYFKPIKYDEPLELVFKNEEYIITDNGYYTRQMTDDPLPARDRRRIGNAANAIGLYDKDFNLIKSHRFDGGYVYEIGYIDGLYYSKYTDTDGKICVAVSSDFDEWSETGNEDIPKSNSENMIADNKVRFNGQSDFTEISYEDKQLLQAYYQTMFGDWFVKTNEGNLYLTKDNVYFVQIQYNILSPMTFNITYVDQDENYIFLRNINDVMFVPKYELYNALNELEEVPYVRLNDKILGFSQPPVMESDRILVPMRFLFEQMGAEVDWNNDTQSAIATIGEMGQEKRVEFSIDNTTALVDGEPETTDVPARLINDQTFVPLRFLSENLGYNVEWDDGARTAVITTELGVEEQ